jgi:hypothetical protein
LTSDILIAEASETKTSIVIDGIVYTKAGPSLGAGSYGKTYKCTDPKGRVVAIKAVHDPLYNKDDIQGFLTEIIIQIILLETSKHQSNGPYVPYIYKVGFNKSTKNGYIVSELMYRTVRDLIKNETKEKNNMIVPELIRQIATILEFFGDKVQFNHRDCKSDNLMYVKDKNGNRSFKLIDFGYSCLKWNNLEIRGKIDKLSGACYRKGRDLSQLMYELWHHFTLSPELYGWLKSNLDVHINRNCSITKGCDFPVPIRDWQNTYTLFNTKDVEPIYNTHTVLDHVKKLQKHPMFEYKPMAAPAPAPAPMPAKPASPKPAAAKPVAFLPPRFGCPAGKIFNPKTGRCVKEDGWAGKQAAAQAALAKEAAAKEAAAKEAAAKEAAAKDAAAQKALVPVKPCPPGKILNPKTLRCVNAKGATAKAIGKKTRKNRSKVYT